jgi:integrase
VLLNPQKVAGLKPSQTRYEVKDGNGLYVVVAPSGVKSFQYRGKHAGKFIRKTVGQFPTMTLKAARDEVAAIRVRAKGGQLPERRGRKALVAQAAPEGMTVTEAWLKYMDEEGARNANANEKWRMWEKDIAPFIGDKIITDVTRLDCATIIRRKFDAIRDGGGNGTGSNRLHGHLSRFFNWASGEGWTETRLEHSPMSRVKKLVNEKDNIRDRWLREYEVKWFLKALHGIETGQWNDESSVFARAFEILLRTVRRKADIFEARWTWLQGDDLIIPATKNGEADKLWLHPSARALIGEQPADAKPGDFIFPVAATSTKKPLTRLRRAMTLLAKADGYDLDYTDEKGEAHFTLHDLRTTATTLMGEFLDEDDLSRIPREVRDRLLSHKDTSVRGRHYDFSKAYREKKGALTLWNNYLDGLRV